MSRFLLRLALILVSCSIAFAALLYAVSHRPLQWDGPAIEYEVRPGANLRGVANGLENAGLPLPAWAMVLIGRGSGQASQIKAGPYEFESGLSPLQVLDRMVRGAVSLRELTLIEGWNLRQIRAAIDAHPDLAHDSRTLSEAQLLTRLGASESAAEGLFFPDTYRFARRASDFYVLHQAYDRMKAVLEQEWAARQSGLPYSGPYQALIMASIVEKETGRDADRAKIAAVFVNRLRAGMMLQTDPSVIFGMGERFDGNVRRADLMRDTPWNTYTRSGLPPTPIATPGRAALRAALQPASTDALYFVARGDGSSEFSRTLDQHNRAVARYQKKSVP